MPREAREFWSLVDTSGDCWIWLGGKSKGYGVVFPGRKAHRVAWELTRGPIPAGANVLHRCDNPPCVNPAHLFLGSIADNNRDRALKGRGKGTFPAGSRHPARLRAGEGHWSARLSDADVAVIRAASPTVTNTALAEEYGVHDATISRVRRGIWRTV